MLVVNDRPFVWEVFMPVSTFKPSSRSFRPLFRVRLSGRMGRTVQTLLVLGVLWAMVSWALNNNEQHVLNAQFRGGHPPAVPRTSRGYPPALPVVPAAQRDAVIHQVMRQGADAERSVTAAQGASSADATALRSWNAFFASQVRATQR